ncbi:hypothetical protein [Amycolatopsis samaneae]|uniref:DUF2530 domain-containing protein n=1 Tax=Amycolatopsis samaneae TaxID=664691 RepID=A0ABW5G707_9PSEU
MRTTTAALSGLLRPNTTPSALDTVARAVTLVWLAGTTATFVVWLLVCLISSSFDGPWWLWFGCVGGAISAGLRVAARNHRPAPRTATVAVSPARNGSADQDGEDW